MNMKFEHAPGGAMAIHAKVPNQLVFKADGTLESATKPDLKTASPETLATVGTVREMNRMPLFFQSIHNGTREGLQRVYKGCATPNDAIQISALTHPELVKAVLRGDVATCDEAAFQADPYQRGKWSRGTAYLDGAGKPQGWVRTPDLNQAMPGSLPPPFWRGGVDAKVGSIGKDMMRDWHATFNALREGSDTTLGGAATREGSAGGGGTGSGAAAQGRVVRIDPAAMLPGHTGTETVPWNITGVSYTITANGIVNEAALDAAGVMGQVLLLQGRVAALENRPLGFGHGQTTQNVTAERVGGVVYTNLTGKMISVRVTYEQNWPGQRQLLVDGKADDVQTIGSTINTSMVLFVFVPHGSTYGTGAAAGSHSRWMEHR